LTRHYAPRTPTEVWANGEPRIRELTTAGQRVGWLAIGSEPPDIPGVAALVLPADPARYSAELYATLHTLDAAGCDRLVVTAPPADEAWLAVNDRLRRAAHQWG
jgi:L-threonylcarbamoyladenylate synthase